MGMTVGFGANLTDFSVALALVGGEDGSPGTRPIAKTSCWSSVSAFAHYAFDSPTISTFHRGKDRKF